MRTSGLTNLSFDINNSTTVKNGIFMSEISKSCLKSYLKSCLKCLQRDLQLENWKLHPTYWLLVILSAWTILSSQVNILRAIIYELKTKF